MNKKIMTILSLALIVIAIMLPTTAGKAQTQEENIVAHNFNECAAWVEAGLLIRLGLSEKYYIAADNPAIQKVSKDVCKFYHEKFGDYGAYHIAAENGLKNDEFLSKYYPNGLPDAVEEILAPLDLSTLN